MSVAQSGDFYQLSRSLLQTLALSFETNPLSGLEVDEEPEALTLHLNGRVFLINIHDTAQQIWLSSPLSGAHHFAYHASCGQWLSTKDTSCDLEQLLTQEMANLSTS